MTRFHYCEQRKVCENFRFFLEQVFYTITVSVRVMMQYNSQTNGKQLTPNSTLIIGIYYSIINDLYLFREMAEILQLVGKH